MTVYHLGKYLYKSTDFGTTWTKLGTPGFSGVIDFATIAENNSDIILVTNYSNIEKSIDGGNTFTSIKGSLPNASISDVAFDPNDDKVIVVTYRHHQDDGKKVFISTNQGQTWQNITYNLNNMPIRSVVIDHTDESNIYLGAEIGVYKKAMADNSWILYNQGLPNMSINELEIMYGSNTLRAATWGRGLWEYALDGREDFPAILTTQITDPPEESKPFAGVDQFVTSTISYDGTITSAYVEWSIHSPVFGNIIPMNNTSDSTWVSVSPIPNQTAGTKVYFKVFAVGDNGDTTETYKFMYETKGYEHCFATGNTGSGSLYIQEASIASMTNISGNDSYIYYSGSPIYMELDSTYSISVNAQKYSYLPASGIDFTVWVDYNRNASFEPNELILSEINAGLSASANFTVPSDAVVNDILRLRIRLSHRNEPPYPCDDNFGEVEDYAIIICGDTPSYTTVSACDSYLWNGIVYTSSGTYSTTLSNQYGCDSTAYLELTILNNTGPCAVSSDFTLINALSDQDIGPLEDGDIIDLSTLPTNQLNVRANLEGPDVKSVRFGFNGTANYRVENIAPYALEGDANGNYNPLTMTPGIYTISATPYDQKNGKGTKGDKKTITISVINGTQVTTGDFTLMNHITDQEIGPLDDGDMIDLATLPGEKFNVRANMEGSGVESVRFGFNGNPNYRTENSPPYALAGDNNGNYYGLSVAPGTYILSATPYSLNNAGGNAGNTKTISFTVLNSNQSAKKLPGISMQVFPNPFTSKVTLELENLIAGRIDIEVYNITGKIMLKKSQEVASGFLRETINLGEIPNGIYLIQVRNGNKGVFSRIVKY